MTFLGRRTPTFTRQGAERPSAALLPRGLISASEPYPRPDAEAAGGADFQGLGNAECIGEPAGTRDTRDVDLIEDVFDEGFDIETVGAQSNPQIEHVIGIEIRPCRCQDVLEAAGEAVLGSVEACSPACLPN